MTGGNSIDDAFIDEMIYLENWFMAYARAHLDAPCCEAGHLGTIEILRVASIPIVLC